MPQSLTHVILRNQTSAVSQGRISPRVILQMRKPKLLKHCHFSGEGNKGRA
ncbi:rCG51243 [Rattus norvegicus]|uniref:RCG51243 n=1 Tax=Rattus norvegicus TaxID=10116 RepID=A6IY73_RAT|nr:rCG51243 [Rattus norvegicus]